MPFLEGPLGFTTPSVRAQGTKRNADVYAKILLALADSGCFQKSFYKMFTTKLLKEDVESVFEAKECKYHRNRNKFRVKTTNSLRYHTLPDAGQQKFFVKGDFF